MRPKIPLRWLDPNPDGLVDFFRLHIRPAEGGPGAWLNIGAPPRDARGVQTFEIYAPTVDAVVTLTAHKGTLVSAPSNEKFIEGVPIPEPGMLPMLLAGIMLLIMLGRRRRT